MEYVASLTNSPPTPAYPQDTWHQFWAFSQASVCDGVTKTIVTKSGMLARTPAEQRSPAVVCIPERSSRINFHVESRAALEVAKATPPGSAFVSYVG